MLCTDMAKAEKIANNIMRENPDIAIQVYDNGKWEPQKDYRFRILMGDIEIDNLIPGEGSWHTYYIFIKAIKEVRERGVAEGKMGAIESIYGLMEKTVFNRK